MKSPDRTWSTVIENGAISALDRRAENSKGSVETFDLLCALIKRISNGTWGPRGERHSHQEISQTQKVFISTNNESGRPLLQQPVLGAVASDGAAVGKRCFCGQKCSSEEHRRSINWNKRAANDQEREWESVCVWGVEAKVEIPGSASKSIPPQYCVQIMWIWQLAQFFS